MQPSHGFMRVSDADLERPPPHIRVEHYRQQVKVRFASALKPAEKARGWQILLIPEGVILAWEQQPRELPWLGNVGAVLRWAPQVSRLTLFVANLTLSVG